MSQLNQIKKQKLLMFLKIVILLSCILFLCLLVRLYFDESPATIPPPEEEGLGEKVIVILPSGKEVYTFENLIVSEDGKLYYRGDRSQIDLTGGIVKYEEWE